MSNELQMHHGRVNRYALHFVDQTGEDLDLAAGDLVITLVDPETQVVKIVRTNDDGITYADQTGETIGDAELEIPPEDFDDIDNRWHTLTGDAVFWASGVDPFNAMTLIGRVIPHTGEEQS